MFFLQPIRVKKNFERKNRNYLQNSMRNGKDPTNTQMNRTRPFQSFISRYLFIYISVYLQSCYINTTASNCATMVEQNVFICLQFLILFTVILKCTINNVLIIMHKL